MLNTRQLLIPQPPLAARTALVHRRSTGNFKLPLVLTLVHIPMGLLLYEFSLLAFLHPLGVLLAGMYLAFRRSEKLVRSGLVAAYLVGAEILWRMASSPIFYEYGKYAAAAIMVTALVRRRRWQMPALPFLYFLFLFPACITTLLVNSPGEARAQLSSNMSGPLLVFVSCWFFSHLSITRAQLKRLLSLIALPLISVAITSLFYTVTIEDIQFTNESNFITSGGFGPNQVSAMLGLGVFACTAYCLLFDTRFRELLYFGGLTLLFAVQSFMTFSRGGMYNAIGAILAILIFQLGNPTRSFRRFLPILGISIVFLFYIFPSINDFTGGKLQERFENTSTTNRFEILASEFQIFYENPVLGIGVGEAKRLRKEYLQFRASSHTEFTRMIAEHGLLGVLSLAALGLAIYTNFRRQESTLGRCLIAGTAVWAGLFMLNAGMRLAAPSYMLGIAFVTIGAPVLRAVRVRAATKIE